MGVVVILGVLAFVGFQGVAHKLGYGTASAVNASADANSQAYAPSVDEPQIVENVEPAKAPDDNDVQQQSSTADTQEQDQKPSDVSEPLPVVDEAAASAAEGRAITAALAVAKIKSGALGARPVVSR